MFAGRYTFKAFSTYANSRNLHINKFESYEIKKYDENNNNGTP
jgi:hypothetical protein